MLLSCIRAENMKLRGSAIWLIFLIIPLISAVYGTFNYMLNLEILTQAWYSLFTQHTLFYSLFFFSPLVGVYCAYLWRIEFMGHNINRIMSQPVPPMMIFFAKFVVVMKLALLTQGFVCVLYVLCGKLFVHLPGFPPVQIILYMLRGTVGAMAIVSLQLLLSMVVRSFAVPVLIALLGGVAGMLMTSHDMGLIWPYALMMMGMNSNKAEDMLSGGIMGFIISCAGFTLLFVGAAWWIMRRRDVRA